MANFDEWQIELHGRRAVYRIAGEGPPVVLVHGMLNSSSHWQAVAMDLAAEHTVIAPDLIGHGDSAAPRGDYSLGAHAASIRDLLTALGIERATKVFSPSHGTDPKAFSCARPHPKASMGWRACYCGLD